MIFCLLAIDWGRRAEEAAYRLMQENCPGYALRTARAAARALEERGR